MLKILSAAVAALAITVTVSFLVSPGLVLVRLLFLFGTRSELGPKPADTPSVRWFRDYFAVEELDRDTYAIAEPRYFQKNINYLILGKEHAVLFDSGPGYEDITVVVHELTALPVLAVASHLHYDHVGNHDRFGEVALLDLPSLRAQVGTDGFFRFQDLQHLGRVERLGPPRFKVSRWLRSGEVLDLGDRMLEVISTPGHTPESLMLFDAKRHQLFSGDFLYAGSLLPGDKQTYLATTQALLARMPDDVAIYGAHAAIVGPWSTPCLERRDLVDLAATLSRRVGPGVVRVNERVSILAPFPWNHGWGSW